MSKSPSPQVVLARFRKQTTASAWLDEIWKRVNGRAGMARRKVKSVQKYSSEADLIAGAQTRNFHVAQVGSQYVVFKSPIDVKC